MSGKNKARGNDNICSIRCNIDDVYEFDINIIENPVNILNLLNSILFTEESPKYQIWQPVEISLDFIFIKDPFRKFRIVLDSYKFSFKIFKFSHNKLEIKNSNLIILLYTLMS